MARYWAQRQYNGDTSPKTLEMVREDLESLDAHGLAYLWREAGGGQQVMVKSLPDSYDPWK